ncbi:MAG TPA: hypothetical protein VGI60_02710 [Chthoniobacterales bacterium]
MPKYIQRCVNYANNESVVPPLAVIAERDIRLSVPSDWYETWHAMRSQEDFERFMAAFKKGEV